MASNVVTKNINKEENKMIEVSNKTNDKEINMSTTKGKMVIPFEIIEERRVTSALIRLAVPGVRKSVWFPTRFAVINEEEKTITIGAKIAREKITASREAPYGEEMLVFASERVWESDSRVAYDCTLQGHPIRVFISKKCLDGNSAPRWLVHAALASALTKDTDFSDFSEVRNAISNGSCDLIVDDLVVGESIQLQKLGKKIEKELAYQEEHGSGAANDDAQDLKQAV